MFKFKHRGDFRLTEKFLTNAKKFQVKGILSKYGEKGVSALSLATPKDTGLAAMSWSYEIKPSKRGYSLAWSNSNVESGVPVVILIQYGHATQSGTFVQGRDFINPAITPILDQLSEQIWEEVSKL